MGLHQRYQRILQGQPVPTFLAGRKEVEEEVRKRLGDAFQGLMHALFKEKGAALRIDILQEPEVQEFIDTHTDVLDGAMQQVPLSDTMRQRLTRSNYIFSGMKTFHELNEAFPSLLDENVNRKSFEQFYNDVQKIDKTYNRNYLRSEYNFVQASANMAAKWESFQQDGDRYYLQYRTQQDEKVRPEHAALHGVTLPMTDSFWNEYYPPNGWNCRCTVVQVRKSKYPATPHDEAMALGEEATGKDTKGMFHFNAGKEQKSVPDYNPYTISHCKNCDVAKGKTSLSKPLNSDECLWCQNVRLKRQQEEQRIARNKAEYERLVKDKNYTDVEFNPDNGGLKAVHIGHNFDKLGGKFEKEVLEIGFNTGNKVILGDERGTDSKHVEGSWNDMPMEVSGKNGRSTNNIKKGLIHCAEKPGCQVAVIYFYENRFDQKVFEDALRRYVGLKNAEGHWTAFEEIICMQDGKIVYRKSHPID